MVSNRFWSKLCRFLLCCILGALYVYGIFLSDAALNLKVRDPYPINGETAGVSHMVTPRSLPHLRAINTLVAYKNRDSDTSKNGENEIRTNEPNHHQNSNSTNDAQMPAGQNTTAKQKQSNILSTEDIAYPILALLIFSLSCRCLLASLIHRHTNQIHEFDFDSTGQIRRTSRPRPIDQRVSFWEVFRTLPTRTRTRRQQPRQNVDRRLLSDLTNRLNQQRVRNGSRPLGEESLSFLLGNNRTRNNFSANDYEELWTIQEENGNASGLNAERHVGVTDEELARYPVRYLEADDELLQNEDEKACSICLEDFRVGEMVRTIPCFHSFHANCIDRWLRTRTTCPICKHETTTSP